MMKELSLAEAKAEGFTGLFEGKYGEVVKTYTIGDFSKEICGGPHVDSTGKLGKFKIQKNKAAAAAFAVSKRCLSANKAVAGTR